MATFGNNQEKVGKSRHNKWDTPYILLSEMTKVYRPLGEHFGFLTTIRSTTVLSFIHWFQSLYKCINAYIYIYSRVTSL